MKRDAAVTVFAAASLTEVFNELTQRLATEHPQFVIRTNFAGSQQLAQQIIHGARANIYATADRRWMEYLEERQLVTSIRPFATNRLVVVAPKVISIRDLASPTLRIVVGAEAVPVGMYTRQVLEQMEQSPEFGSQFTAAVRENIVSEEDNVRAVLAKVVLGEADAGFVYATDVIRLENDAFEAVPIPDAVNVSAEYLIARVTTYPSSRADVFLRLLGSPDGQALLVAHGFTPATGP